MMVGVLELRLSMLPLEKSHRKKAKRRLVRSVLDRIKGRFHVAAAEVGAEDDVMAAILGFSAVSSEKSVVNGVLSKVQNAVEEMILGLAELSEAHFEVVPVSFEYRR